MYETDWFGLSICTFVKILEDCHGKITVKIDNNFSRINYETKMEVTANYRLTLSKEDLFILMKQLTIFKEYGKEISIEGDARYDCERIILRPTNWFSRYTNRGYKPDVIISIICRSNNEDGTKKMYGTKICLSMNEINELPQCIKDHKFFLK